MNKKINSLTLSKSFQTIAIASSHGRSLRQVMACSGIILCAAFGLLLNAHAATNDWHQGSTTGPVVTVGTSGNDTIVTDVAGGVNFQPFNTGNGTDTVFVGQNASATLNSINVAFLTLGDGDTSSQVTILGDIATIADGSAGIHDTSNGVSVTLGSTGSISTTGIGSDGIEVTAGSLNLTTNGSITTSGMNSHGVSCVGDANLTVSPTGSIATTGIDASAIDITGNATISIGGAVTTNGMNSAGLLCSGNSVITIADTGSIATTGIDASAISLSSGTYSITCNGAVSSIGITASAISTDGNTSMQIGQNGSVSSTGFFADAVFVGNGDLTLDSSGLISASGNGAHGISADGDATIHLSRTGVISTTGVGGDAILVDHNSGGSLFLNSDGTIMATGASADAIFCTENVTITLDSHGLISSALENAIHAIDNVDVINRGLITVTSTGGEEAILSGLDMHLQNEASGSIICNSNNTGAGVLCNGFLTLNNAGLIRTTGVNLNTICVGQGAIITNSGTIESTNAANNFPTLIVNNVPTQIYNTGVIDNESLTAPTIQLSGTGDDILINDGGTIISRSGTSIDMGDGDDTIIILGHSHILGTMDGGTQNTTDRLQFVFFGLSDERQAQLEAMSLGGSLTYWGETYTWTGFETIEIEPVRFEDWAQTFNQQQMAQVFDKIDTDTPDAKLITFLERLYRQGPDGFRETLNEISPQRAHQALSRLSFANHDFIVQHLNGRSSALRMGAAEFDSTGLEISDGSIDPTLSKMKPRLASRATSTNRSRNPEKADADTSGREDHRLGLFLSGNVMMAEGEGNRDIADYNWTTASVLGGADYRILPSLALGVMGGYSHTDVDLDNIGSDANVDTYTIGTYLNWWWKHFYANALFDYSWNDYRIEKNVPTLDTTHHSDPSGDQFAVALSGGYDFQLGAFGVGPIVGLRYVNWSLDHYKESGSTLDTLRVDGDNADSLRSQLGGRATYSFRPLGSCVLTPELRASWNHEFLDDSRGVTSHFNSDQLRSFTIRTDAPERDWADVGVSLRAQCGEQVTLFVDYDAQVGQEDFWAHSVQAGVRVEF